MEDSAKTRRKNGQHGWVFRYSQSRMLLTHALGRDSGPSKSGIPLSTSWLCSMVLAPRNRTWAVVAVRYKIANCTLGSSDFGTLKYFKQIWIAVKILRSNY
jgi:hypothetical protein